MGEKAGKGPAACRKHVKELFVIVETATELYALKYCARTAHKLGDKINLTRIVEKVFLVFLPFFIFLKQNQDDAQRLSQSIPWIDLVCWTHSLLQFQRVRNHFQYPQRSPNLSEIDAKRPPWEQYYYCHHPYSDYYFSSPSMVKHCIPFLPTTIPVEWVEIDN